MPQPFASGTTVVHQPRDAQGNPVGAPFDGVVQGNVMRLYFPVPPGPDTYKRREAVWSDTPAPGRWELAAPNQELTHNPPGTFRLTDGVVTTTGTAHAVA